MQTFKAVRESQVRAGEYPVETVPQQGHSSGLLDTMLRSGKLPIEFKVGMSMTFC